MRTLAVLIAGLLITILPTGARKLERAVFRVAQLGGLPPAAFAVLVGSIAFAGSALLEWLGGISYPFVHDEFSYLLMADTFSEGRLANPSHPLWPHFETFHVLQQPTYASKYPPGQGVVLAVGQVVFGRPIVGVWLSAAVCAVAVHWMLVQWLPRRWAAVGVWIFLLKIALVSYWSHSYWGGYVAAIGGALVAGAARRLADRPAASPAAVFSVGTVILANSRPFEGLVLCVVCAGWVALRWFKRTRPDPGEILRRTAMPALLPLLAGALAMGIYNRAVTHDAWTLPYTLHQEAYHAAPIFLFQEPGPVPDYDLEAMRRLHLEELELFREQMTLRGALDGIDFKWTGIKSMFVPRGFGLFWLVTPFLFVARSTRAAAIATTLVLVCSLLPNRFFAHYVAPYTALFMLMLVSGLRLLRLLRPAGRPLGRAMVPVMLLFVAGAAGAAAREYLLEDPNWIPRSAVVKELLQRDGEGNRHLVIVRYGPTHSPHREWVFNRADIDSAEIVWARDLGARRNRELLDYFSDRRVWRLFYDSGQQEFSLVAVDSGSSADPD